MQYRKLSDLKELAGNPREISHKDFAILCKSIQDNPKYFEARPLIISDRTGELVIIAGNMRYKAAKRLKLKQAPTFLIEGLTERQEQEITIRDNVSNGQWDFDALANAWDGLPLTDWGVDISADWITDQVGPDGNYSRKVEIPTYEPKNEKPEISVLYDFEKYKKLITEINNSSIPKDVKMFLSIAASRHIVFDYSKIADYYAHSEKDIQELMENSALVIVDFNKSIELGFVKLSSQIADQYSDEYEKD